MRPALSGAGWTYAAAARRLRVSRQRLHQMVLAGKLGTVTYGGRTYVSDYSLRQALEGPGRRAGRVSVQCEEEGGGL